MRVRFCVPIMGVSLISPVFTIVLEGMPDNWREQLIPYGCRLPNCGWMHLQREQRRLGYQGVRRNTTMATPDAQGQPRHVVPEPVP